MSSRSVLVLAVLLLAGIGYLLLDPSSRPDDDSGPDPLRLLDLEPEQVRSIEIAGSSRDDVLRLERRENFWWMTRPQSGPAADSAVEALLGRLSTTKRVADERRESTGSTAGSGADPFGFEDAAVVVTLTAEGAARIFELGDPTPVPGKRYARVDGGPVALVEEALFERLALPAIELRDRQVLALDPYDADLLAEDR